MYNYYDGLCYSTLYIKALGEFMDRQKISDFIDIFVSELNPGNDYNYAATLKELVGNLVDHYSKLGITSVPVQQDGFKHYMIKPTNGEYSLEDFFLNRLFFNVRKIETQSNSKGHYDNSDQSIGFNFKSIDGQFKHEPLLLKPEHSAVRERAKKKVVMHEFEHAMQSRFDVDSKANPSPITLGMYDKISRVNGGRYAGILNSRSNVEKGGIALHNYNLHVGLYTPSNSPLANDAYRTDYIDDNKSHHNMNEIFNESESLLMAGVEKPQTILTYPKSSSGNFVPIFNNESSNAHITTFGFMLKQVMGAEESFKGMYFQPTIMMKKFNQDFGDIFAAKYGNGKSAWEHLQAKISEIRAGTKEHDYLDLTETLAKCLVRRVEREKGRVPADKLLKSYSAFVAVSINNYDETKRKALPHFRILSESANRIKGVAPQQIQQQKVQQQPQKQQAAPSDPIQAGFARMQSGKDYEFMTESNQRYVLSGDGKTCTRMLDGKKFYNCNITMTANRQLVVHSNGAKAFTTGVIKSVDEQGAKSYEFTTESNQRYTISNDFTSCKRMLDGKKFENVAIYMNENGGISVYSGGKREFTTGKMKSIVEQSSIRGAQKALPAAPKAAMELGKFVRDYLK